MQFTVECEMIYMNEGKPYIDPSSIKVDGYFSWLMLEQFLFGDEHDCLTDIADYAGIERGEVGEIKIHMYKDYDDYRSWLSYKEVERLDQ